MTDLQIILGLSDYEAWFFNIWLQEEGLIVLWKTIFHKRLPTLQKDFLNRDWKDASDTTQGAPFNGNV